MDSKDQTPEAQTVKWRVSERLRDNAKAVRRDMTDAERIIWYNVRAHRFQGGSFRRKTPIGCDVGDFACHGAWLIVEIDDDPYFESAKIACGVRLDAYLKTQGYRVLRFNNHEVMKNKAGVLETIAEVIRQAPSLTLARKGERRHGSVDPQGTALPGNGSLAGTARLQECADRDQP